MNIPNAALLGGKNIKGLIKRVGAEANRMKQDKSKPGHVHKDNSNNSSNNGGGGAISQFGAGLMGGMKPELSGGRPELTQNFMDPLEEASLSSYGTNNSFQNDEAGITQTAEQYGKSIAFGGQQAQQFFARQYGRPVTPPNSNPQNFNDGPLAMDPSMIIKAVGAFKESNQKDRELGDAVNKNRDMNSGINFNGNLNSEPGLLGAINKQSKMVSDHMQGRKKLNEIGGTKAYTQEARELKQEDYAKHPEVIAHKKHAERTN